MAKRGRPKKEETIEEALEVCEKQTVRLSEEEIKRKDKLNEVLRGLSKKFGKNTVKFGSDVEERERLPFINQNLTEFTGGGIPKGTYTTIWGSKGCAKTTIVLDLIAKAQELGETCAYVNGERSYDSVWAKKMGVDIEKLIVIDVETIEEGLDAVIKLCREKVVDFIAFDSLHGLAPEGELYEGKAKKEKSVAQSTMALRARKLSQFFEMATPAVANSKCAVVLIGQSRMDLGSFIKIETLTGGHALLHNSRLILKVRRGQGVDAPVKKEKVEKIVMNSEGDKVKKTTTISTKIGFDLVIKCNKAQISGIIEGQEIHLPFYYTEGLKDN